MRNTFMCCPLQGSWVNFDGGIRKGSCNKNWREWAALEREPKHQHVIAWHGGYWWTPYAPRFGSAKSDDDNDSIRVVNGWANYEAQTSDEGKKSRCISFHERKSSLYPMKVKEKFSGTRWIWTANWRTRYKNTIIKQTAAWSVTLMLKDMELL